MALTGKMLAWANAWLETYNKTEASRRAGYKGNDVTLASVGYENFNKPQIQEYINHKLTELAMPANEVLSRLTSMARSDIADFADVVKITDLKDEKYKGKSQLIKKFKRKITRDALNREHEDIELEFYDAQAALLNIGKQHGLFSDRHIVDVRLEKEIDEVLNVLEEELSPDDYSRVLARLSGAAPGSREATEPNSDSLAE